MATAMGCTQNAGHRGMDAVHLQTGEISVPKLIAVLAAACGALVLLPAVAAACNTPNPDPNVVWMTGMEHGRSSTESGAPFAYGSNAGGSGGPDSTINRPDNPGSKYSLKLAPAGGLVYRERVVAWQPVLVERFYIRLATPPASNVRELASVYTIANAGKNKPPRYAAHLGYNATTHKLTMELNTQTPGTPVPGTTDIVAGNWYRIDLTYDVSTPNNKVDWAIDGAPQTRVTLANGPSTLINEVVWGTTFNDTFTANYDDFMLSQTAANYPLGPGRILGLKPNESDPNQASPPNPPTSLFYDAFSATDERPITADTWMGLTDDPMDQHGRHIAQETNAGSSYVQIGFADDPNLADCIRAVAGWMSYDPQNLRRDINNGKTSVFNGSTESVIYSGSMTYPSTNIWTRTAMVTPPANAAGWTASDVNGLVGRVGYSTDATPSPWWDALMLEYEASP
jgi:hypothetical protein